MAAADERPGRRRHRLRARRGRRRPADADAVPDDIRFALSDRVQAEELAERGRKIAKEAGVGKVVVQAISGDPASVLLEAAKDFDADLIVVGSKGLTSHAHFILGQRGVLGGPPRSL